MPKTKQEIITFKADEALLKAMKGISNRSEFIRNAILTALNNVCPVCKGSGILTPHQKTHMDEFLTDHSLEECEKCSEMHLVCSHLRETIIDKGNRR
ncbi:MAG: CopG family transcriptional regulator [Deltaproteobacteria bacterium]|jgi:hypothetical protein|nr:CopG family transcriptional regulator [Deltaproteobacteria bacterium]